MDGPPAKRARTVLEELRKQALEEGEGLLHELPEAAQSLLGKVQETFPHTSLDEVDAEYEAMCTPQALEEARESKESRQRMLFVRAEIDKACRRFSAIESWLKLKTPKIEDGNNFGVEVQRQLLTVVQDYRNYAWKELCALKSHSWNRAVAAEAMEQSVTEEHSEIREGSAGGPGVGGKGGKYTTAGAGSTVGCARSFMLPADGCPESSGSSSSGCSGGCGGGCSLCQECSFESSGVVTKSTRMVRRNTHKTPRVLHYHRYMKELEVEFYFKLRHTARNLAQYYLDLYDMLEKNWEKIFFPRGRAPCSGRLMY